MGGDVDRSNVLASSFVVEVYGLFVSKLAVGEIIGQHLDKTSAEIKLKSKQKLETNKCPDTAAVIHDLEINGQCTGERKMEPNFTRLILMRVSKSI
jgi:hypothetical protein